ncbi:MAG: hypothetical protein QOI81_1548 [Actinomycetota bacterium]|jgi:hypothetical protein|nr:hypothetical protein [Actinomycetota bacterium]
MRVEFYRPAPADAEPDAVAAAAYEVAATADWREGTVVVNCEDPELNEALVKVFRATSVVVQDDSSYRRLGTNGPVVLQPGDLEWFRAAAQIRASKETGLVARMVPGVTAGGFDPAAGYRDFTDTIERLDDRSS